MTQLRDALIQQSPSLALQRAAAAEIARLDSELEAARREIEALKILLQEKAPE